jgi:DNA-binding Lrp family transcriptional regulator
MIAAFVLVNCHFPFDPTIMDAISKMPSVTHVYRTEGRYDLMVKVKAETRDLLTHIISKDFGAIHGVDATLTMFIA